MSQAQKTRPDYNFTCPHCNQSWSGDDIGQICKNVAWHWNKEHNSKLRNHYEKIDEQIIGGHNVHENEYIVEKVPIYLTSFDIIKRLGQEDGFAVLKDRNEYCSNCMKHVSFDTDEYDEADVLCSSCKKEREIKQIKDENHQLDSFGIK